MNIAEYINGYEYLSINGTFSTDLTRDGTVCFEETFNIVTIESNTTVVYSLDEEENAIITVTVNRQSKTF